MQDEVELTPNAERALIFEYILFKGELPENYENDSMKAFGAVSGLGEAEVAAAYAELEDKGMLERND